MTWAKLDDSFPENPKISSLSDRAFRLHVTAICYSARLLTDGKIPRSVLPKLGGNRRLAAELEAAGVWETDPAGWCIHDYLEYNPSREEATTKRVTRVEAGRRGGQRSGEARRSKTEANASKQGEAKPKQLLEAKSNPVPSRPVGEDVKTSSSSRFADDDDLTPAERDLRETVLSKLPQQYQRDPVTADEAADFARDFAGQDVAVAKAIQECRRANQLPFPGNLRRHMPRPEQAASASAPIPPRRLTPRELAPEITMEYVMSQGKTEAEAREIVARYGKP